MVYGEDHFLVLGVKLVDFTSARQTRTGVQWEINFIFQRPHCLEQTIMYNKSEEMRLETTFDAPGGYTCGSTYNIHGK